MRLQLASLLPTLFQFFHQLKLCRLTCLLVSFHLSQLGFQLKLFFNEGLDTVSVLKTRQVETGVLLVLDGVCKSDNRLLLLIEHLLSGLEFFSQACDDCLQVSDCLVFALAVPAVVSTRTTICSLSLHLQSLVQVSVLQQFALKHRERVREL